MNTNLRNTLISIAIIVTIILLVYFIMVYPSTNRISVIWLYFLYYAAFVISIIAAIYYFWNYKADGAKFKNSLEYNFVGTLNCAVGTIGFLQVDSIGLPLILLTVNLFIGISIYKDIFTSSVK